MRMDLARTGFNKKHLRKHAPADGYVDFNTFLVIVKDVCPSLFAHNGGVQDSESESSAAEFRKLKAQLRFVFLKAVLDQNEKPDLNRNDNLNIDYFFSDVLMRDVSFRKLKV